ncbi:anti-sigma B factor antagonist [Amycolatopsis pretoriensis]|uniref:Anti-sigma factor antagonist n=1 Tax=Amycolatopsis pretoriensis TaxID=218821 RepID=A0A1H5QDS8_9PSEU|nr:STAS domain-containing protein [Amycolatopsis pretoriensis]SEF24226.1 anti-sigma B factor antagonist [Amycolatopsis pretoriensis]
MDDATRAGSPLLRISHRCVGTTHVIEVAGEVDAATAPELGRAAGPEFVDPAVAGLVVDLTGVGFIDSAGLTMLARLHSRTRERGAAFTVVAATHAVKRALRITGLDELFTVASELDGDLRPE